MALNLRRYLGEAVGWVIFWLGVFLMGSAVGFVHLAVTR